jgi:hypothetical protein
MSAMAFNRYAWSREKVILKEIGLEDIKVFAAKTRYRPEGSRVCYIWRDGSLLGDVFKEAHVDSFLRSGYRMVYIGKAFRMPRRRGSASIFSPQTNYWTIARGLAFITPHLPTLMI